MAVAEFAKLFFGQISELPASRAVVERLRECGVDNIGGMFTLSPEGLAYLRTIDKGQRRQFSSALAGMGFIIPSQEGQTNGIVEFALLHPAQQMKFVRSVSSLCLTARARTLMSKLRVEFVGDLIQYSFDKLQSESNVGPHTLTNIQQELDKLGLALGTTIIGWNKETAARIASSNEGQLEQLCDQEGKAAIQHQVPDLLSQFVSEQWVQIAMKFYGFDGSGQNTLEAFGQEFDLTGDGIKSLSRMRDRFPQRLKLVSLLYLLLAGPTLESGSMKPRLYL